MTHEVERTWITGAGLTACVLLIDDGRHRCGYVGVPSGHPLHGVDYGNIEEDIEVHGGITYAAGKDNYPVASEGLWWFGYDCAHHGDAPGSAYLEKMRRDYPTLPFMWRREEYGVHRDLSFCEAECERLAAQLAVANKPIQEQLIDCLNELIGWIPGEAHFHTDAPQKAVERARAAIAKAKGEA